MVLNVLCLFFLILSTLSCVRIRDTAFNAAPETSLDRNYKFSLPTFNVSGGQFVRFAIISDSHQNYSDLEEVIEHINDHPVSFVVHLGDFSDFGIAEEYEIFGEFLDRLRVPAMVLPGNHDLKTFRSKLYKKVFGPTNLVFDTDFGRLVFWNDCLLAMRPETIDFDFITSALGTADNNKPVLLFHHHPPTNPTNFLDSEKTIYTNAINSHPQVFLFHGHVHTANHGPFATTGYSFQLERTREMNWAEVEISDTTIRVYYCRNRSCTKVYENTVI